MTAHAIIKCFTLRLAGMCGTAGFRLSFQADLGGRLVVRNGEGFSSIL